MTEQSTVVGATNTLQLHETAQLVNHVQARKFFALVYINFALVLGKKRVYNNLA